MSQKNSTLNFLIHDANVELGRSYQPYEPGEVGSSSNPLGPPRCIQKSRWCDELNAYCNNWWELANYLEEWKAEGEAFAQQWDRQPQMVKVVKSTNSTPLAHIKLKPNNPLKIIKIPTTGEGSSQHPTFQPLKFQQVNSVNCTSKLVQVPVETLARLQQVTPKVEPVEPTEPEEEEEVVELESVAELSSLVRAAGAGVKQEPAVVAAATRTAASAARKGERERGLPVTVTSSGSGRARTAPQPLAAAATMSHARRRHDAEDPPAEYTTKRRKHADKVGKGLRHFSMKVCEKVRTKGFTSYNEVADELVLEFATGMHGSADSQQYDQKNIRRRVYDALNVLMAMNIISKDKKEIRWLGLPTNSVQECTSLERERQAKLDQIQKKTQQLQELILQHISFKSLIERNKEAESRGIKPSASSAIHLPFIVVNTSDKALIDCSISNDKTEYMFNFNKRFQIHDDIDILKRMGLLFGLDKADCTEADIEKVKNMVPKSLETYVEQMARGHENKFSDLLEEEDMEEPDEYDEEALEPELEEEEGIPETEEPEQAGDSSDDDSSDVDV